MSRLKEILTGRCRDHVIQFESSHAVIHRDIEGALQSLRRHAKEAGFDLAIASSFRDYNSQLNIWNLKSQGKRAVLDSLGNPLDVSQLDKHTLVFAILRWSSLPGASRHHWGTDIDVFDRHSLPKGYQVQLIPKEAAPGGILSSFNGWLNDNMGRDGFFRPYAVDKGGVSPEWWHLSYAPISQKYYEQFDLAFCQSALRDAEFEFKDVVMENLEEIYTKFISNITLPENRSASL